MVWELFIKGLLLGFAVAVPVGPIGLLCMDRSLRHGKTCGFFTGLGAAVADTLYGAIAAFGLSSILDLIIGYEPQLRLFGGVILVIVGVKMYLTPPPNLSQVHEKGAPRPLVKMFSESLLLTLSNPMTILGFMAVYAGLGIKAEGLTQIWIVLLGVFLGASAWWMSLSVGTGLMKQKLNQAFLDRFSKGAALVVGLFGVVALVRSLMKF
jgi:threonine/homoserine/homoserine lactone efflux protein